jgi:hypothetical protein
MEKLLLGDLHFQKSSYDFATDKILNNVFQEEIWPYIDAHQIKEVIQLGDFTHDKKAINKRTESVINECFIQPLLARNIKAKIICGNHDAYSRNTNVINSLQTLFREIPNIQIIDVKPHVENNCVYLPWGFNPKDYPAKYAFGHLEVKGFEYQKGIVSKAGNEIADLDFFNHIYAGHFHRKSTKKNITYLGSLIALDFGEVDTEHGFYKFNDETGSIEFIKTQAELFKKIIYTSDYKLDDNHDYYNQVISIVVKENDDKEKYEKFLRIIYEYKPLDVKITNLEGELRNIINLDSVDSVGDILSISKQYIEKMELHEPLKNNILFDIFSKTYEEAMTNA